jgi:hypothetical protein
MSSTSRMNSKSDTMDNAHTARMSYRSHSLRLEFYNYLSIYPSVYIYLSIYIYLYMYTSSLSVALAEVGVVDAEDGLVRRDVVERYVPEGKGEQKGELLYVIIIHTIIYIYNISTAWSGKMSLSGMYLGGGGGARVGGQKGQYVNIKDDILIINI